MEKISNQKGFTLIEISIVVIIISVIFLLSVPNIQKNTGYCE
jgi:prepilin-type N-terminal cleavage/methylation domain-containing protein